MPTPVFASAYQVEVRGMLFGQLVENVWHCQGPTPFDADVAHTIADIFSSSYGTILGSLSQDLSVNEIFVHNLAGVASGEFTLAITPGMTGGVVQDSEPGVVAFCIALRTALAGRTTRGRKYFPGLAKGDVVGNLFSSTRIDALLSAISALITDLDGNGTPLSIFSPTATTLVPVTSPSAVDNNVDAQRRRLTGRGR